MNIQLTSKMLLRSHTLLILLFVLLFSGHLFAADQDVTNFDKYWNEVQKKRLDYESTVSQIQTKHPDYNTNSDVQKQLQDAQNDFNTAKQQIAEKPEYSSVSSDAEIEKKYWNQQQKKYQQDQDTAKSRLDARLENVRKKYPNPAENAVARKEIQKATNEYYDQSREIAAKHQKNVQDMVRDELSNHGAKGTGKSSAPLKDTAGSGRFQTDEKTGKILKDPSGNPILNKKHRGTAGDTDGEAGGRTADADTVRNILVNKGLGDLQVDEKPGYLSIGEGKDAINLTINKSGEDFDQVGSSAHETKVQVDAESKETSTHIQMKDKQPGKKYVAVQDHKKKALKGLTSEPTKLIDDPDALQGMAKGTIKSLEEAQLPNATLKKIIKDNKLNESPKSLKAKLRKLKEGQSIAPDGVGLNKDNIGKYQKAAKEIIDASEAKTKTLKDAQVEKADRTLKKLQQSDNPEDKKRATELKKQLIDTELRVKSTEEANERKAKKYAAGEDPDDQPGLKKPKTARQGVEEKAARIKELEAKRKQRQTQDQSPDDTDAKKNNGDDKKQLAGDDSSTSTKGVISKTTTGTSNKKVTNKDGSTTTISTKTVEQDGVTSSSVSRTTNKTKAKKDGSSVSSSTTDSNTTTVASNTESSSTTKTVQKADGSKRTKTTSSSTKKGPVTTTTTTGSTTTTQDADGYQSSTGSETSTTNVGSTKVTQQTDSTSKGWTNKDGTINTDRTNSTKTTKIGDKTVGKTHTTKDSLTGKYGDGDDDAPPAKKPPNITIKLADNVKVDETGNTVTQGGNAKKIGDNAQISGGYKVQTDNTKHTEGTTITIEPDGSVKVGYINEIEKNALKVTADGKIAGKVAGVGGALEAKGEFTAGGRAGFKTDISVGVDGIKSTGEVDIFIGMKAEGEVSGTLDLKDHIYISVKGTLKGHVSAGAGLKAGYGLHIGWTKISLSGEAAASLGFGGGGQASVEVDMSVLTTGVDLEKVGQQDNESKILANIIKSVKIGRVKLPKGKTWKDILPEMQKKLEWLAKNPQLLKKDQKAFLEIMKSLKFEKGKGKQKFISVRKHQKDWYCTNKPVISSKASMSEMINKGN